MIAAWMLFAIVMSGALYLSASIAERALRQLGRPVRVVWIVVIAVANLLPLVLATVPTFAVASNGGALAVSPDSIFERLNGSLLVMWGVAAGIGVIICASAIWRMARTRLQWKNEHVANTPVLVSHDVGPALVGVMQYSIVVPQWAHTLEEGAKRLLLAHEREHARKYDPLLLEFAALAVVAAPWNVFNWLFFRRLHLAVELDCDQRVLRTHPDPRSYGALLLDVAERVLPSVIPAAAFVEHGASLETRINAMSDKRRPFALLRGASGLALSAAVALAACFTPRPYAIVIVNPPAPVASAQTVAVPATVPVEPARTLSTPMVVQSAPAGNSNEVPPQNISRNEDELRPVPPSARVKALDEAENERMRLLVAKNAPRALGNFNRADSALVLLLNDNGEVRTQSGIALSTRLDGMQALSVFGRVFPELYLYGVEAASSFTIDRGANGETLRTPLKLFTAYQIPGIPAPRTIAELTPASERIRADVRARHPEAFIEVRTRPGIAAMLYDTKGTLIRSAMITPDSAATGDPNYAFHKAFGTFIDGGKMLTRGHLTLEEGYAQGANASDIVWGTLMLPSEATEFQKVRGQRPLKWEGGSFGSRSGSGRALSTEALTTRLKAMVQSRVPDAYGAWARGDSALMFLFDANDQLVARRAGAIPDRRGTIDLAEYISLRDLTVPSGDIEAAGWTNHISSESGRILDKPLVVIWGRLSGEATRKRELAKTQYR